MKVLLLLLFVGAVCAVNYPIRQNNMPPSIKQEPGDSTQCTICKWIVTTVQAALSANETVQQITDLVTKGCGVFIFPNWVNQCEKFVSSYLPLIIQMISQGQSANQICSTLSLCSSFSEMGRKLEASSPRKSVPLV